MNLLELHGVTKRHRSAGREVTVLDELELTLGAGQLAIIWGARRSGRSTLLRIAAGIEAPDSGTVTFEGAPLSERSIGTGIGYVAKTLRSSEEQGVLDQIAAVLLARGLSVHEARERARHALKRVEGESCAAMRIPELGGAETLRVAIARTLALAPKLLVIDEPAATIELSERDEVLGLMRTLTRQGVSVLASTGEAEHLEGADIALSLRDGHLHGADTEQTANVLTLRRGA